LQTAFLVFFTRAAGTGVVAPDVAEAIGDGAPKARRNLLPFGKLGLLFLFEIFF
jgi:hypothetical protein